MRLALAVATVALACTNAGSAQTSTVRDSAGIRIIENRAPIWTDRTAWRVSAEPVVQIGAVSSPHPAYELSRVRAVRRLSDGRMVVLDGMSQELRWFDVDGRHLRTGGGNGNGPGEFIHGSELLVLPGDTILVVDGPRGIEQEFFGPEGDPIRTERLDLGRLAALVRERECLSAVLPDRSLLRCREEPGLTTAAHEGRWRSFDRYVRVPATLDTVHALGLYGGLEQWGVRNGDRLAFTLHPFFARTAMAAGGRPLRIAIATGPAYSIELWTPDGRLERIVRRTGARRRATREENEAAAEFVAEFAHGDEQLLNRMLREIEVPDSLPAMTFVDIARTGELWVTREGFLAPHVATAFDVFDTAGRFLGTLRLPPRFRVHEIGEDWILGVRRDEYDVEYVELYALDRR